MELQAAETMARSLMAEHGLTTVGVAPFYTFEWMTRATCRFGYCTYPTIAAGRIALSRKLVLLNPEARVRNTILHEIAHALAFKRYGRKGKGHGSLWRMVAAEIGADPVRCYPDSVVRPPAPYVYRCASCGFEQGFYRIRKRLTAHAECCRKYNGGRFSLTFRFVLVENKEAAA